MSVEQSVPPGPLYSDSKKYSIQTQLNPLENATINGNPINIRIKQTGVRPVLPGMSKTPKRDRDFLRMLQDWVFAAAYTGQRRTSISDRKSRFPTRVKNYPR